MSNKEIFGMLATISALAILFTEQGEKTWMLFGFIGLFFGVIWMFLNK